MFSSHLKIATRFTLITTVLFGLVYPLVMTGYARIVTRSQADGQLLNAHGNVIGSRIIGQNFTSDRYFHGRPSVAGAGYDATSSGGSNLALSNRKLLTRIDADTKAAAATNTSGALVPAELVEASGSGLDPDISPASALFQIERVAKARHLSAEILRATVERHVEGRQLGFMGEPRVNVLELNLALDEMDH